MNRRTFEVGPLRPGPWRGASGVAGEEGGEDWARLAGLGLRAGTAVREQGAEALAAFEDMKPALEDLRARLPDGGPRSQAEAREAGPFLAAFLARYS